MSDEAIPLLEIAESVASPSFEIASSTFGGLAMTGETIASLPRNDGNLKGYTDIFIYPGYKFKVIDHLITNFHLPKSTLLLLVSAFAGKDFIFEAHRQAIREKYRFFSYGDSMLIT